VLPSRVVLSTHLLKFPYDTFVAHEPFPRQKLNLCSDSETLGLLTLIQGPRFPGQGRPLRYKVPLNQGEDPVGEQVGTDVEVASIPGAKGESLRCEAVLGDVCVGCGQDGALCGVEGPSGLRVIVRVVRTTTARKS
jgi:hypothetical protein